MIALGVSIGSGEFLLGPAVFVKHGLTLLWITGVAIFFQTVFNTEEVRYVVATGEAHTVEEFVAAAFDHVGLDWREHVRFDQEFVRGPTDPPALVGDPTKIRERLGWEPEVRFGDLVGMLVEADVADLKAQAAAAR